MLHFWLQMKSCSEDPGFAPGSLWVFRCQVPNDVDEQFDLKDDATNGVIALRLGSVAIIADFLENGVHQEINSGCTRELSRIPLHPMQFRELVALIVYEASLLGQHSEVCFFQMGSRMAYAIEWRSTVKGDGPMNPWNNADYAKFLSFYSGLSYEKVYQPPNRCLTWLHDASGSFVYWPLGEPHPSAGVSM